MVVTIYGTPNCTYCDQAKRLCEAKGIAYEYKIVGNEAERKLLEDLVGSPVRSVPQIFIADSGFHEYVGGFHELKARFA